MSMVIENENKLLRFNVPNSEANINAQHYGIKARTVGSYYLSERYDDCMEFLNNFETEFYIDILLSLHNAKKIINFLIDNNYSQYFKQELKPQITEISALNWLIDNEEFFIKIDPPTINENKKYLKLDNNNEVVSCIKTLILGDLCSLVFKKIGDSFIIYIDKSDSFDNLIENNTILKWIDK